MGRVVRLVALQRQVRARGAQANPRVRQPRAGERWPRLRRGARAEEELQRRLPLRRRQVVLVVVVVVVQRRLHPVQEAGLQQPGAQERRQVLRRRQGPRHAALLGRNMQR